MRAPRRLRTVAAGVVLVVAATLGTAPHAAATPSVVLEQTFTAPLANGWAKVERYRDTSPGFLPEGYPPDGRGDQTAQSLTYFGAARPASGRFTLHYGAHWQTGTRPTPVLLVTGAGATADFPFANPADAGVIGCGSFPCPTTGLAQYLDGLGYQVFSIGFPHKNGDNYYWAEQIHDAIQVIQAATGAPSVDVVALSKGVSAARMYLSSFRRPWGTPYAGDVRRFVQIGGANLGFDWGFRHGANNIEFIYPECGGRLNAPAPVTAYTCFGIKFSHPELGYASGNFPGSGQLIARRDGVAPRNPFELGSDVVWNGGTSPIINAPGIQSIIDTQSIVQPLLDAGIPVGIGVYQLCGNAATLPGLHNEHTAISDGAVMLDSCNATTGIGNRVATTTLPLNHLQLAWHPLAVNQIEIWLR